MTNAEALATARSLRQQVQGVLDAVGTVDVSTTLREKGCTVHFKFSKKVSVLPTTKLFYEVVVQGAPMIVTLCTELERALIALGAEAEIASEQAG